MEHPPKSHSESVTSDMPSTEDDIAPYRNYARLLGEHTRLYFSISGVEDNDRQLIENALQELFSAEITRQAQDELRARGLVDELFEEGTLRTSLEGVPLSGRDQIIWEAKVRQLAQIMRMPRNGGDGGFPDPPEKGPTQPPKKQASSVSGNVCICLATSIPGTEQNLVSFSPLPLGIYTTTIFLFVNNIFGRAFSGDTLKLTVEPGAPFGIGPNEMKVGLASRTNWAKEIYAWNLCKGKLASVHQSGPSGVANYMLLTRGCNGADTIVFTKPQFGGVWADVANVSGSGFWPVFEGRQLTFTWLTD